MKTPGVGSLVNGVDEILAIVRGRLALVIKRTERGDDGIDYMVLVEDPDYPGVGTERTIWSCHVDWDRNYYLRAVRANEEQQRVADEVWNLSRPDDVPREIPARWSGDRIKRGDTP